MGNKYSDQVLDLYGSQDPAAVVPTLEGVCNVVGNNVSQATANTKAIQSQLNKRGVVSIPGGLGDVYVNAKLTIYSNTKLISGPGTFLRLAPNCNCRMLVNYASENGLFTSFDSLSFDQTTGVWTATRAAGIPVGFNIGSPILVQDAGVPGGNQINRIFDKTSTTIKFRFVGGNIAPMKTWSASNFYTPVGTFITQLATDGSTYAYKVVANNGGSTGAVAPVWSPPATGSTIVDPVLGSITAHYPTLITDSGVTWAVCWKNKLAPKIMVIDENISILGLNLDHQAGSGLDNPFNVVDISYYGHTVFLGGIIGLTVDNMILRNYGYHGICQWALADFSITNVQGTISSTSTVAQETQNTRGTFMQLMGPARNGIWKNLDAQCATDDTYSWFCDGLASGNHYPQNNFSQGDLINIHAENLTGSTATKLFTTYDGHAADAVENNNATYRIHRMIGCSVTGLTGAGVVKNGTPSAKGIGINIAADFDALKIDGVDLKSINDQSIVMSGFTGSKLTLSGLKFNGIPGNASTQQFIYMGVDINLTRLEIDGILFTSPFIFGNSFTGLIRFEGSAAFPSTVGTLAFKNLDYWLEDDGANGMFAFLLYMNPIAANTTTIKNLLVDGLNCKYTSNEAALYIGPLSNVKNLVVNGSNLDTTGGGHIIRIAQTAPIIVNLTNNSFTMYKGTTTNGVIKFEGGNTGVTLLGGGNRLVSAGGAGTLNFADLSGCTAGFKLTVRNLAMEAGEQIIGGNMPASTSMDIFSPSSFQDVSFTGINKTNGCVCQHTGATNPGFAAANGTNWKNILSGLTII